MSSLTQAKPPSFRRGDAPQCKRTAGSYCGRVETELSADIVRFLLVILICVKEASYPSLERRCLLQITDGTGAVEELPLELRGNGIPAHKHGRAQALQNLLFFLGKGSTIRRLNGERITTTARAAVEEGVLPGGGVALLRAIKALEKLKVHNDDQRTGIEIVKKAISWPTRQIAINAGEDGSIVVGKILEKDTYAFGYDAQAGEYGNLISKGIIDPTKVVRAALQGAASVAGLLITTEAMVAEVPKKQSPAMPGGPGGGMGGMGGMDF
jgi:hypothetical protein